MSYQQCKSFEKPKFWQVISKTVYIKKVLLPKEYSNSKVCIVTHFTLKCKRLKNIHISRGRRINVYNYRAYNNDINTAMLGNNSGRFGFTINRRQIEAIEINAKYQFNNLKISKPEQSVVFIHNSRISIRTLIKFQKYIFITLNDERGYIDVNINKRIYVFFVIS